MAWLTGSHYRKSVSLSRPSGAITNYQMLLKVGESAGSVGSDVHCEELIDSNFDSIRFTSADEVTNLSYWIESISGVSPNQLAKVWVKFDSIGINDTNFYMYFGNDTPASASDGTAVFEFFDHFSGNSLDLAHWFHWYTNGTTVVANSVLSITGNGYNVWGGKDQFGQNYAFHGRCKISAYQASDTVIIGFDDRSKDGTTHGATFDCGCFNINAAGLRKIFTKGLGTLHDNMTFDSDCLNYRHFEIQRLGNNSVDFIVDEVLKVSAIIDIPVSDCGIFIYTDNSLMTIDLDFVFISKILEVAPTWGTWEAIETDPSASTVIHGWGTRKWNSIGPWDN